MAVRAERIFVLAILVFAVAYTYAAATILNPPASADPLGPRAFPLFLGAAGIVLLVLILLERQHLSGLEVTRRTLRDLGAILAALAAYALLLPRLGFILATTGILAAGFTYAGGRRVLWPAAGFAVVVYLFFTRVLELRLPHGFLRWM